MEYRIRTDDNYMMEHLITSPVSYICLRIRHFKIKFGIYVMELCSFYGMWFNI